MGSLKSSRQSMVKIMSKIWLFVVLINWSMYNFVFRTARQLSETIKFSKLTLLWHPQKSANWFKWRLGRYPSCVSRGHHQSSCIYSSSCIPVYPRCYCVAGKVHFIVKTQNLCKVDILIVYIHYREKITHSPGKSFYPTFQWRILKGWSL